MLSHKLEKLSPLQQKSIFWLKHLAKNTQNDKHKKYHPINLDNLIWTH
jgi:hypothetical protein